MRADAVERRQLLFGGGAAGDLGSLSAKPRYRVERRARRAKAAQQRIKRYRADRLGAREA
jgi:hypothetical protein